MHKSGSAPVIQPAELTEKRGIYTGVSDSGPTFSVDGDSMVIRIVVIVNSQLQGVQMDSPTHTFWLEL